MKQRLSYFLGQDGFLKMNTTLPEFTVYFRKENGFVSMVILLNIEDNPYVTKDAVTAIKNKAKWRFIDQGFEEVHYLVLSIADDVEMAKRLAEEEPFYWIVDAKDNTLVIPEGHVEDFYGLKGSVEGWLKADFNGAVDEGGSYRVNGHRTKTLFEQPLVNHFIFAVNIIVFTLCTLTGEILYNYGRLALKDVLDNGEWYRMLTALFLHGNVTHIASNMIMLFLLGNVVEKEMGHIKYFILYFGSGLVASAASLYLQYQHAIADGTFIGSIGASGAIFGIMGGFLWVLLRNRGRASNMSFVRVLFLVCYSLFGGLTETYIDNAAHFGGLFAGVLIAILIYRKKKSNKEAYTGEN